MLSFGGEPEGKSSRLCVSVAYFFEENNQALTVLRLCLTIERRRVRQRMRNIGLCFQRGGAIFHVAWHSTSFGTCFTGNIIVQYGSIEYIGQHVLRTLQPQNIPCGWIWSLKSVPLAPI